MAKRNTGRAKKSTGQMYDVAVYNHVYQCWDMKGKRLTQKQAENHMYYLETVNPDSDYIMIPLEG